MPEQHSRTWTNRIPVWLLKIIFNIYPPYLGSGVCVKTISPDFRFIEVHMKMHWYNKNYVGTHFGGSIFALCDPFYMLMLIRNLGPEYLVWDKAGHVDFKKPGRGTLKAVFHYTEEEIAAIRKAADESGKYIFDCSVDVLNEAGETIATVTKTLYVAKKPPHSSSN